jgi:hypothetical protein
VISLAVPAAGWRVVHARRLRHPTISTTFETRPQTPAFASLIGH